VGIGYWGLGPIPNPQSPIPNPQSPLQEYGINKYFNFIIKKNKINILESKLNFFINKFKSIISYDL